MASFTDTDRSLQFLERSRGALYMVLCFILSFEYSVVESLFLRFEY